MIYRFTLISDEVDDFIREIKIDSEATFFDLHEAILKAAGYKDDQMTSFFICDDDWEKDQEITLEDMGSSSEEDSYIMRETRLSDLVEDEKQKLLYVFDPLAERVFFIELSEIITGKDLDKAVCSRKAGEGTEDTGYALCRPGAMRDETGEGDRHQEHTFCHQVTARQRGHLRKGRIAPHLQA